MDSPGDFGAKLQSGVPYKLYIFDLDGTLFLGEEPIPGAADALGRLRSQGSMVRFLTNNSSQSRANYVAKLVRLGFEAYSEEVYSSAIGTAAYLRQEGLRTAFVIGEPGLQETLMLSGVEMADNQPEAVVVGICKSFTYPLLSEAMQHIRAGARFVATNTDPTYPMEGGRFIPGSGSLVAAVQTCAEVDPFIVGKPNPFLVELILREAHVSPANSLMVGDRMDTDIAAGIRAHCPTLLVLTGATKSPPDGQDWVPSVAALS